MQPFPIGLRMTEDGCMGKCRGGAASRRLTPESCGKSGGGAAVAMLPFLLSLSIEGGRAWPGLHN